MLNNTKVGIIHYGCGNIYNVTKTLKQAGFSDVSTIETGSISSYDLIVLPGVGSFSKAMEHIEKNGYLKEISKHIEDGKGLLGICLGMQLLMNSGEEFGHNKGLNVFDGTVLSLKKAQISQPLPHVGLNKVTINGNEKEFYFDHSYQIKLNQVDNEIQTATTTYDGHDFISYIKKNNVLGVQFHPELSGEEGINFLRNMVQEL